MKRKLYMVLLALAMAWSVQAQSLLCNQVAPKYEVRAVWLTTIGDILDRLRLRISIRCSYRRGCVAR